MIIVFVCSGDPPWPATANATQGLLRIVEAHFSGIPLLDPVADFKLTSMDFVERKMEKQQFEQTMIHYSCLSCPQFKEHVRKYFPFQYPIRIVWDSFKVSHIPLSLSSTIV